MSVESDIELHCSADKAEQPSVFEKLSYDDEQEKYSCQLIGCALTRRHLEIKLSKPWSNKHKSIDIFVIKSKSKREKLCSLDSSATSFQWSKSSSSRDQLKLLCCDKIDLECIVHKTAHHSGIIPEDVTVSEGNTVIPAVTHSPGVSVKSVNENTPIIETDSNTSPMASKAPKKRARDSTTSTPNPKSRRQRVAMRALTTNMTPPPSKVSAADSSLNTSVSSVHAEDAFEKSCSTQKPVRCVDLSSRVPKPSSRWGHTMSHVSSELAVLIGGQGDKSLSKDSIWFLHPEMRTWKCPEVVTEGVRPEFRIGHTATYDPTMRCIYVYGGSKNTKWFHDVHMFDLDEQKWSLVKAEGKAPTRAYHTSTLHRHELWVFGGVFPRPDPQPDGCDNEVHIFSPIMQSWYKPIVMGDKPRSRSGHSANLINDVLVVFGGWDFPYCYNDLFILDLTTVEWSEPKSVGSPPKPRSWHASCTLTDSRIFIHGGYDGDNALHDSFIFNYYSKTWQELVLENAPSARAGHACFLLHSDYENQDEDEVIVFGGGDNDGAYFSDMLSFYVPHDP